MQKKKMAGIGRHFTGWLLSLTAATLILQGCGPVTSPQDNTTLAAAPQPAALSPAASPARPDEQSYIATGPIIVENQVDVLAQREGVVKKILVDVGAAVSEGTVLALLDDSELTAKRDAAEAKVQSCEADLQDWRAETKVAEVDSQRAQEMGKAGINTQEEVDHARYKFEGSEYEVQKAERILENAKASLGLRRLSSARPALKHHLPGW